MLSTVLDINLSWWGAATGAGVEAGAAIKTGSDTASYRSETSESLDTLNVSEFESTEQSTTSPTTFASPTATNHATNKDVRLCGTWGCTLPDCHTGIHRFPEDFSMSRRQDLTDSILKDDRRDSDSVRSQKRARRSPIPTTVIECICQQNTDVKRTPDTLLNGDDDIYITTSIQDSKRDKKWYIRKMLDMYIRLREQNQDELATLIWEEDLGRHYRTEPFMNNL